MADANHRSINRGEFTRYLWGDQDLTKYLAEPPKISVSKLPDKPGPPPAAMWQGMVHPYRDEARMTTGGVPDEVLYRFPLLGDDPALDGGQTINLRAMMAARQQGTHPVTGVAPGAARHQLPDGGKRVGQNVEIYDEARGQYVSLNSDILMETAQRLGLIPVGQVQVRQEFTVSKEAMLARLREFRQQEKTRVDGFAAATANLLRGAIEAGIALLDEEETPENAAQRPKVEMGFSRVVVPFSAEQKKALADAQNVACRHTLAKLDADIEFLELVQEDTIKVDGSSRFASYLPTA